MVNGIITFLILSGIVNKEMKKEKGIQHETFKRPLMDMSGKESNSLYDLVLSELAKNMALSVTVLDLINFREPKLFIFLNINLTENKNTICLCGRNQFSLQCTWYLAK